MARLSAILLHRFGRDGRNGVFRTLRTIVCGLQTRDVVLSSIRAQKDNAKIVKTIHTLYFAEGRRLMWIALVMRLSDRYEDFSPSSLRSVFAECAAVTKLCGHVAKLLAHSTAVCLETV